jgi:hypothetical protein
MKRATRSGPRRSTQSGRIAAIRPSASKQASGWARRPSP